MTPRGTLCTLAFLALAYGAIAGALLYWPAKPPYHLTQTERPK